MAGGLQDAGLLGVEARGLLHQEGAACQLLLGDHACQVHACVVLRALRVAALRGDAQLQLHDVVSAVVDVPEKGEQSPAQAIADATAQIQVVQVPVGPAAAASRCLCVVGLPLLLPLPQLPLLLHVLRVVRVVQRRAPPDALPGGPVEGLVALGAPHLGAAKGAHDAHTAPRPRARLGGGAHGAHAVHVLLLAAVHLSAFLGLLVSSLLLPPLSLLALLLLIALRYAAIARPLAALAHLEGAHATRPLAFAHAEQHVAVALVQGAPRHVPIRLAAGCRGRGRGPSAVWNSVCGTTKRDDRVRAGLSPNTGQNGKGRATVTLRIS